jgi:CRP/FNR family transcriptional regulator, cyclic AMP receptor protein
MPVAVAILRKLALLHGLPPEILEALGREMSLAQFARRGVVINQGDKNHALGFLLDGRLQGMDFTLDGREVGLYFVAPGDYFGELSVVDHGSAPEFVIALGHSQVAFLPHEAARRLITTTPTIAEVVMRRLSFRVRNAVIQRTLLSLPNPFQRLCAQLLALVRDESSRIEHAPTHQEIAIMINTSRETVTRAFQILQTRSILSRDGTAMLIRDCKTLEAIANGLQEPPKA